MKNRCLFLMLACGMLSACYDDSELKDAQALLEDRVSALETLKEDLAALKEVVDGKITVVSCLEGENAYTMTLSDGKVVTIYKEISESEGLLSGVEEIDGMLVITLADGVTEYVVPMVDGSQMTFFSVSGKQYFTAGQTKNVTVEMIGVDNFTVTEKPDGWKAVLSDGTLAVTAPSAGGETSGVVKMLGIGKEPMIAQIYVEIGSAPCSIVIADDMTVTITPVSSCFYGASLLEDFNQKELAGSLSGVTNPMLSRHPFTASAVTMPLSDLVEEVVPGETYIVWALPVGGAEPDMMYESVSSISVGHQVSEVTFEDARMTVSLKGTDTFYLVPMTDDITLDNVISDLHGSYADTYDRYRHTASFRGMLSELVEYPLAGQEYEFLVLPVKYGVLRKADAVTFKVGLPGYLRGGSASLVLEKESAHYKSVSVKVTGSGSPYKVLMAAVSADDYTLGGFADDAALLDYLTGLKPEGYDGPYTYTASNLSSGTQYMVLAAAVDADGKVGTPVRLEVSTRTVEYGDVVLAAGDFIPTQDETVIPLTASGEIASVRYFLVSSEGGGFWYYKFIDNDQEATDALVYETVEFTEIPASELGEGISLTGLVLGVDYVFRAIGIDASGRITNLVKADFAPSVGAVIASSDSRWTGSRPAVSSVISRTAIKLTVEFSGDFETYVLTRMSSEEYLASRPGSERLRTDWVISHGSAITFTENIIGYDPEWYISSDKPYILLAWKNADGWHEPLVYDSGSGNFLN